VRFGMSLSIGKTGAGQNAHRVPSETWERLNRFSLGR